MVSSFSYIEFGSQLVPLVSPSTDSGHDILGEQDLSHPNLALDLGTKLLGLHQD
jgi:hypothetical protein